MAYKAAQREVLKNATFREAFVRFLKDATPRGAEGPNLDAADQAHLDRWVNDSSAEEVWQKIQKLALKYWPASTNFDLMLDTFIAIVPFTRRIAENAPDPKTTTDQQKRRLHGFQNRAEALEDLAGFWRKEAIFQKKVEEKMGVWPDDPTTTRAAESLAALATVNVSTPEGQKQFVDLQNEVKRYKGPGLTKAKDPISKIAFKKAEMYEQEARFWRKLLQLPPPKRKYLLSRQSSSRKQRFFMQAISKFLILLCGRPMDYETAVLNDIAFDTAEATTPLQARSARRPSTRLARLKPHKSGHAKYKKSVQQNKKKHFTAMG